MTSVNYDSTPGNLISRRRILGGTAAAFAAAAVLMSVPRHAHAADFVLYNDARTKRISVTRRTRTNRVECIVEEKNERGVWEPVVDAEVLVRPKSESGSFDIEKTNSSGLSLHSAYSYTSGMEVGVSTEGVVGTGTLT